MLAMPYQVYHAHCLLKDFKSHVQPGLRFEPAGLIGFTKDTAHHCTKGRIRARMVGCCGTTHLQVPSSRKRGIPLTYAYTIMSL